MSGTSAIYQPVVNNRHKIILQAGCSWKPEEACRPQVCLVCAKGNARKKKVLIKHWAGGNAAQRTLQQNCSEHHLKLPLNKVYLTAITS